MIEIKTLDEIEHLQQYSFKSGNSLLNRKKDMNKLSKMHNEKLGKMLSFQNIGPSYIWILGLMNSHIQSDKIK